MLNRIERLHHVGGQVHARIGPDQTALRRVEHEVDLLGHFVEGRQHQPLELRLQLLREPLQLLLRVLGRALNVTLLLFDFVALRARSIVQHGRALLQLLLIALHRLVLCSRAP